MGDDNKIYVVDFGAVQDNSAAEGVTFTVVGTYGYAPLEQFSGKTVPASDLYALGVTLIHLLTRTAPINLPTKDVTIQFRHRVTVSPQLANWLDKMIAPAVEKRFTNATSALQYLLSKNSQELDLPETNNSDAKFSKAINSNPSNNLVAGMITRIKNFTLIQKIILGGIILLFWQPLMSILMLILIVPFLIIMIPFWLISVLGTYYFGIHFLNGILASIVANHKGYNFRKWLLYGLLGGYMTLIWAIFLKKK